MEKVVTLEELKESQADLSLNVDEMADIALHAIRLAEKYKSLAESQSRVLEGFISDTEDLKARLINVRDNVRLANETVILEEHDEALYGSNDSLNYIIDFLLTEIEEGFKQ